MIDNHFYWKEVYKHYKNNPNLRYGQAAYVILEYYEPELANKVWKDPDLNPFYLDRTVGEVWVAFEVFINALIK